MDWLDEYIDYTHEQEAPTRFHQWIGLVTIAAVLKRQVWVDRGFYRLYPNLYVMLVGPSGKQKKSTAIGISADMLRTIDSVSLMEERMTPEAIAINLNSTMAEGNTVKRLSALHIVSSELQVMFAGNQQEAFRTMVYMTRWFDCPDVFPFHTVAHGPIDLANLYITWAAGTTPEWLRFIPPDAQGGFVGRIMFIYSDERKRIPQPKPSQARPVLIEGLRYMSQMAGEATITPDAQELFNTEYMKIPDTDDPRQAGFYERIHDTWLKVSTLLAVSGRRLVIDRPTLERAIQMVAEVTPGSITAMQYVGTSEHSQDSDRILRQLSRKGGKMTRSEVLNANAWKMSATDLAAVMASLEIRGLVKTRVVGRAQVYELTSPSHQRSPEDP